MNPQEQPDVEPAPESPRGIIAGAFYWMRDLVMSVVIAVVIILFLYQPVKVEGTSMMPALEDQERIFINKFLYRFGFGEIERGDTVVFLFPRDTSKSYIKRVIGVPGDEVEVIDGVVKLNGQVLPEPYVPEEFRDRMSVPAARVPEDCYFVMGDHRSSSNDSRNWGVVPKRYIYGKAVFVYWPLAKMGILR
jgi:signal peptidase I